MTNSFGISPQRQIYDRVAAPEKPAMLPKPAAPAEEPQQVGGQLLYRREYQEDKRPQQLLNVIQDFVKENGVFDKGFADIGQDYLAGKKQQALNLIRQEAEALRVTSQIADDTERLRKAKEFELARENQLRNPYVNFLFYSNKAKTAQSLVSVKLAKWGEQNAARLAQIEDPAQRKYEIAQYAKSLEPEYADLPESFISAKIDPLVAQTVSSIDKQILGEQIKQNKEKQEQDSLQVFFGRMRLGAELSDVGGVTASRFKDGAFKSAIDGFLETYVGKYRYTEREAFALLHANIGNLSVDKDGNGINDIGERYNYLELQKQLKAYKTKDGISLADLTIKGVSMERKLIDAMEGAMATEDKFEKAEQNRINRAIRNYDLDQDERINSYLAELPPGVYPDQSQIDRLREKEYAILDEKRRAGTLPPGKDYFQLRNEIDAKLPYEDRKLAPATEAALRAQLLQYKADGVEEMPEEFAEQVRGTNLWRDAVTTFAQIKVDNRTNKISTNVDSIVNQASSELLGSFTSQDRQIVGVEEDVRKDEKLKIAKQAAERAKPRFKAEFSAWARRRWVELSTQSPQTARDNPAQLQQQILAEGRQLFFSRPEYNDVDRYYNITDVGAQFGQPISGILAPGSVTGNGKKIAWNIDIRDTDNRASWSTEASVYFKQNPTFVRKFLNENFVFNRAEMGELVAAASTGDMDKLSQSTRRSVANLQRAFGNNVPLAEIVSKQVQKYLTPEKSKHINSSRYYDIANKLTTPVAATGSAPRDHQLYVYNFHHSHSQRPDGSGNMAIDFQVERGNQYQTANQIYAPFSGRVVEAGVYGGLGNSVVIIADQSYPEYGVKAGDRHLLGHAARILVSKGQKITRGTPLLLAGDQSPVNSTARSTTGVGTPGHIHSQLFQKRPGENSWPSQSSQYSQNDQAIFFRKAFYPLYSKISDPNRR